MTAVWNVSPFSSSASFSINLQNGPSDSSDIAFHFGVRLVYGNERNIVVRNTRAGGTWGAEERAASHFPFMPNAAFDIIIMADAQGFKVNVCGVRWLRNAAANQ